MHDFLSSIPLAYINLGLGTIGFSLLLMRTTRRWLEYPREMRLLLVVSLMFIFALLETSLEQILAGAPFSFNSLVIFFVKAFLLYVLWVTRTALYRTGTREGNNTDNQEPNKSITHDDTTNPESRTL